jgi:hypothetical protein
MLLMPDKGFRTVNVTEQIYQKIRTRAQQENKSITAYATQVLASVIETDEKLSHYSPFIEVVGFEGNSVILRDHKLDRIIEIYLHEEELSCVYDDSKDCVHVSFCHALPQVKKVVRV